MGDAKKGVWVMSLFACACVFGAPCFAQAPDQGPGAWPPVLGGPGRLIVVRPGQPRPGMRPWGPEQATGAPDTDRAGDIPTAWASLNPDDGIQWLQVDFDQEATIAEVRIRESFNPGAVSKVVAILQGQGETEVVGKLELVLWQGNDPTVDAPADFVVRPAGNIASKCIKIYLDTDRVPGWNEIDAVELVAKDGKRQWASRATASSTYADAAGGPIGDGGMPPATIVLPPRIPDPFANMGQKRVIVHLDGDKSVAGTFVRAASGFVVIEQPEAHKTLIVNVQKIVYLEGVE